MAAGGQGRIRDQVLSTLQHNFKELGNVDQNFNSENEKHISAASPHKRGMWFSEASISADHDASSVPVHSSRIQIIFCSTPSAPALTLRTEFSWPRRIPMTSHSQQPFLEGKPSTLIWPVHLLTSGGSGSFGSTAVLAYIGHLYSLQTHSSTHSYIHIAVSI